MNFSITGQINSDLDIDRDHILGSNMNLSRFLKVNLIIKEKLQLYVTLYVLYISRSSG